MYKFFSLNSGRNLRNITCLLFPSHDFVSVSVRFFSQDTAFYIVIICALMVSSLGLSACFINDKRA